MVGLSSFLACQAPVYRESSAAVSWMYPHFWLVRHLMCHNLVLHNEKSTSRVHGMPQAKGNQLPHRMNPIHFL